MINLADIDDEMKAYFENVTAAELQAFMRTRGYDFEFEEEAEETEQIGELAPCAEKYDIEVFASPYKIPVATLDINFAANCVYDLKASSALQPVIYDSVEYGEMDFGGLTTGYSIQAVRILRAEVQDASQSSTLALAA
jgi:hypothetical protein